MTDLDSKLLGEKNINYASDSEDESDDVKEDMMTMEKTISGANTGPKGVLEDYRQYKEIKKIEDEIATKEKIALLKQQAFTADPNKHPDKENEGSESDFDDDEFLRLYHEKRLNEMKKEAEQNLRAKLPHYNKCFELTGDELVDTIDKEHAKVLVVVHLYDENLRACIQMNKCFDCLAQQYPYIRFCKVEAASARVSLQFKLNALPTIQVYKEGVLIGNFIRMMDKLDHEFFAADVENFLIDSDIISSASYYDGKVLDSDNELD